LGLNFDAILFCCYIGARSGIEWHATILFAQEGASIIANDQNYQNIIIDGNQMWLLETKVCWKVISNVETSLMDSISNNIISFASDQRES
jgi:hypothetical protein